MKKKRLIYLDLGNTIDFFTTKNKILITSFVLHKAANLPDPLKIPKKHKQSYALSGCAHNLTSGELAAVKLENEPFISGWYYNDFGILEYAP